MSVDSFPWRALPDDIRLSVLSNLSLDDAVAFNLACPDVLHSRHIRKRIRRLSALRTAWVHSEQSALPSYANPPHLRSSSARSALSPVEFTHVTTLTLQNCQITSLAGVHELSALRVLDASNNRLTDVPDGIIRCSGLRVINLGNNQFTHVPPVLMELTSMCTLLMHYNPITYLPDDWSALDQLYRLGLFECRLSGSLPDTLCELLSTKTAEGRRRTANLQHNSVEDDDVRKLFQRFPSLCHSILI